MLFWGIFIVWTLICIKMRHMEKMNFLTTSRYFIKNIDSKSIKSFVKDFKVMIVWLLLFWGTHIQKQSIDEIYETTKYQVTHLLNQHLGTHLSLSSQQEIDVIFQKTIKQTGIDDPHSPVFQEALYQNILSDHPREWHEILQSLILGLLYGFAYLKTITRIRDEALTIDVKSFSTFSLTSGGMVLVNGMVPGSVVYLESFLLAGYAVYLHGQNIAQNRHSDTDKTIASE